MLRHIRLGTLVALLVVIPAVAAAAAPFAYITNSGSGNVSVIDVGTNAEVDRIALPVGAVPYGVALSPDGKTLYAANFGNVSLYVVDLSTKTVRTFGTPSLPFGVAVHPSGSYVYVTHSSPAGGTTYFDTATFTPHSLASGRVSAGVAPNAARGHLYIANLFGLTVFDLSTHALVTSVAMGTRGFGVAVHPKEPKFYVALPNRNQLAVVDSATFSYTTVNLPGALTPQGVAVSPDGKLVFVSNHDSGNVSVVDGMTDAFIRNVPVQTKPYGLQVTADGSRVYVANWQSSSLSIINTTDFTVRHVALGGTMPVAFGLFMLEKGAITVGVDIMPGSNPNSINLRANGTLPVAILGSAEFNVSTVDPASVTVAGAPVVIKKNGLPQAAFDDVNGDGFIDLVVHVDRERLHLTAADTEAALEGKTYDGAAIHGVDSVKVVP